MRAAFRRQLLRLAHRHEAGAQSIRQSGSEDEAARFDADYRIDFRVLVVGLETVDDSAQPGRILQQRGDVVEENARLGEIGNFANKGFQGFHERVVLLHATRL